MYNKNIKGWEAICKSEKELLELKSKRNPDLKSRFLLADNLLSKASGGKDTATAVYEMEQCANENYPDAVFAMGEMYRYGWAVKKDLAKAKEWYEKAAALGSREALRALEELNRRASASAKSPKAEEAPVRTEKKQEIKRETEEKRTETASERKELVNTGAKPKGSLLKKLILIIIAATVIAGVVFGVLKIKDSLSETEDKTETGSDEDNENEESEAQEDFNILVGEDTELKETVTYDEFIEEFAELREQYDTEAVIRGEVSTNRLSLIFEGGTLDLSDFLADKVVYMDKDSVVIQFDNEEEAQRCLEALKEMDGVKLVYEDRYDEMIGTAASSDYLDSDDLNRWVNNSFERYESDYTSYEYLSWGVIDMGMDKLAGWLADNGYDDEVIVAVIDTGIEINDETEDRVLKGLDGYGEYKYGWGDGNGHGTHVSGTVLDASQGLNVKILPLRAGDANGSFNQIAVQKCVQYAVESGADVVNMSFGGERDYDIFGSDSAFEYFISLIIDSGAIPVIAAGNESDNASNYSPCYIEDSVIVSAYGCYADSSERIEFYTDNSGNIKKMVDHETAGMEKLPCSFTNYGDAVDVAAPGENIVSYGINGNKLALMDGTSMAAPHISALAAMLKLLEPNIDAASVNRYLYRYSAIPQDTSENDEAYWGMGEVYASLYAGD